jgi:hypothetical protein
VRRMLTTVAVVAISIAAPATALADPGQTATDSVGTVQVAQPGLTADAAVQAPTSADANDGVASDPQATVSVETTPAAGGDQTADNSTGTVQIGGGGNQTADDSTGTVQVGGPGTRQLASAGPPDSPQEEAPSASERSPAVAATPRTVGVVGVQRTRQAPPQRRLTDLPAPTVAGLPFTGLPLWLALLGGVAALAFGIALRRRWSPTSTG